MADDFSFSITVHLSPGIPVSQRHALEHGLENVLSSAELGAVDGGGGFADGESSDIFLFVADIETSLDLIRRTLRAARVPRSTPLSVEDSDDELPLYTDQYPPLPWWRFW